MSDRYHTSYGAPSGGQGRTRAPDTTNARHSTTGYHAPNGGTPPSAMRPSSSSSASNNVSAPAIQYVPLWEPVPAPPLALVPVEPLPLVYVEPLPIQVLPPWETGFFVAAPSSHAPPTLEIYQPLTIESQHNGSNGPYFLMPGPQMARYVEPAPSGTVARRSTPSPPQQRHTPPHALRLAASNEYDASSYYLPTPGGHITLVWFPETSQPWGKRACSLEIPDLMTVSTSMGVNELIRQMDGLNHRNPPNLTPGITTCTLHQRGVGEVEPKNPDPKGNGYYWVEGETYNLSGAGKGEMIGELQGFLKNGRVRGSVGLVCRNAF